MVLRKFYAKLSIHQIVIPSDSGFLPLEKDLPNIPGEVLFTFDRKLSQCQCRVALFNLDQYPQIKITKITLHLGRSGMIGPIISDLWKFENLERKFTSVVEEILTNQKIIPQSLSDQRVNNIASLYEAINKGYIYIRIEGRDLHGDKSSIDLLRGQIFP